MQYLGNSTGTLDVSGLIANYSSLSANSFYIRVNELYWSNNMITKTVNPLINKSYDPSTGVLTFSVQGGQIRTADVYAYIVTSVGTNISRFNFQSLSNQTGQTTDGSSIVVEGDATFNYSITVSVNTGNSVSGRILVNNTPVVNKASGTSTGSFTVSGTSTISYQLYTGYGYGSMSGYITLAQ